MRILAIGDEESKLFWDYYEPGVFDGIDLILSTGDLDPRYLSFIVTFAHAPVLYVRGNHDDKYESIPPEGCICIEDQIYEFQGIRILGLGGSMRYRPGNNQYTERQMARRVGKLRLKLLQKRGFDILLTHAPAFAINDGLDLPHQGFRTFRTLMDKYHPRFFIHGHVHMSYGRRYKRYDRYGQTHIINSCGKCIFDYEDVNPAAHIR